MNTLNMQMFKDGNRTILVLNNCSEKLNEIITKIVAEASGTVQQIRNVRPVNMPEPKPPVIQDAVPESSVINMPGEQSVNEMMNPAEHNGPGAFPDNTGEQEDINEHTEVAENGFKGFVKVFRFWKNRQAGLSPERNMELFNFCRMYAQMLKNTPAESYTDEGLKDFLETGLSTVYSDRLKNFLTECGFLTLQELLNGGRPVLEYVYNACVGRN